jgi:hypothetical protein
LVRSKRTDVSHKRQPALSRGNPLTGYQQTLSAWHEGSPIVLQPLHLAKFDVRHKRNEWIFWIAARTLVTFSVNLSLGFASVGVEHVSIRRLREHAAL